MQGKAALVVTLFLEWSGTLACRVAGSHAVRAEMRRSDKHMFLGRLPRFMRSALIFEGVRPIASSSEWSLPLISSQP
jgi:hypothetical protein